MAEALSLFAHPQSPVEQSPAEQTLAEQTLAEQTLAAQTLVEQALVEQSPVEPTLSSEQTLCLQARTQLQGWYQMQSVRLFLRVSVRLDSRLTSV